MTMLITYLANLLRCIVTVQGSLLLDVKWPDATLKVVQMAFHTAAHILQCRSSFR